MSIPLFRCDHFEIEYFTVERTERHINGNFSTESKRKE